MKVWIVNKKKIKKLVVKVAWFENGKEKTQTKESFNYNEKKKAEALKITLQNKEKIDAVDQKITFNFAFNEYFKVLNNDPDTSSKYKDMQVSYITNHVAPYINKEYLSDYLLSDFIETTLIGIKNSKRLDWRTKDGKGYYVKRAEAIGKVTIKAVVLEFKKFVNWCNSHKYKIDYSIANFKFPKNYFSNYTKQIAWMPTTPQLLAIVNKEPDIKLKTFFKCAAETGVRLNELLGICYESVDFNNGGIHIDHSIDNENKFRPYKVKTSRRFIEISDELLELFSIWMKTQIFPVTHRNVIFTNPTNGKVEKRTFKRVFNISGSRANKKIKQCAKLLGIDWQNGMSPFRKWSISRMQELKILTEKQMDDRFANSKEIRDSNYIRDLNLNEKQRKTAINQITKG
ncbi:tyrosine-type recombinase/integrase [uncultured Polaribacter sp.]|uniref:tyrosine-type recombinase/integrase n=1 Tax=uncultured Polaribacter sp. TaxID=174711 RepID=UPI00259BB693|nr:tyrosine-type recombinase/integrase [uncultured Polaribacter sp.]